MTKIAREEQSYEVKCHYPRESAAAGDRILCKMKLTTREAGLINISPNEKLHKKGEFFAGRVPAMVTERSLVPDSQAQLDYRSYVEELKTLNKSREVCPSFLVT